MSGKVKFNVEIVKNGSSKPNEYKEYAKILEGNSKYNSCINLLKIEFSKWVQPLVVNTQISILEVTELVINNVDLVDFRCVSNFKPNKLFTKIIFGGLLRIAMEASNQTGADYADYLNKIYNDVESTCNEILSLLNS